MKKFIIYHHNDDDGYCSGAIIYKYLLTSGRCNEEQIITNKIDYVKTLDLSDIGKDDVVYFVDYSFSKKENVTALKRLVKRMEVGDGMVYWIDHHKSSMELIEQFKEEKDSILSSESFVPQIDLNYCAAVLCYQYAITELENRDVIDEPYDELYCATPTFIRYIDDYDSWKHNLPGTKAFHIGMMFKNNNISQYFDEIVPSSADIFTWQVDLTSPFTASCIDKGKVIEPYTIIQNKKIAKSLGFPFTVTKPGKESTEFNNDIIKYRCFAVNGFGNSAVFGDSINSYDMVFLFTYDGEQYKYSIYSVKDDIDCSEVAKYFGEVSGMGGGGHKGAAGFQSKELMIHRGDTIFMNPMIKAEEANPTFTVLLASSIDINFIEALLKEIKGERISELISSKMFCGEPRSLVPDKVNSINDLTRMQTIDAQNASFIIRSINENIVINSNTRIPIYGICGEIQPILTTELGRRLKIALEKEEVLFMPRIIHVPLSDTENNNNIRLITFDFDYK